MGQPGITYGGVALADPDAAPVIPFCALVTLDHVAAVRMLVLVADAVDWLGHVLD